MRGCIKRRCIRYLYGVLLWCLLPHSIEAGDYAESLLRVGVGARSMAMGGAYIALADDGTAAYWNPAGLAQILSPQIYATHAFLHKSLAHHSFFNVTFPLKNQFTIGLSSIYLNVDDIPGFSAATTGRSGFNQPALPGGALPSSDTEQVYMLSLAKLYKFKPDFVSYGPVPIELPIAVNIKYLHQSIGNKSSNGFGMDIGMMLRLGLKNLVGSDHAGHLAMGLTVRDVTGTYIDWKNRNNETIKPGVRMGFSYTQPLRMLNSTLVVAEQHKLYNAETFSIGGEYWYNNLIAVRIGYGERFTTGAGLILGRIMLDYAFKQQTPEGTHRVSASLNF